MRLRRIIQIGFLFAAFFIGISAESNAQTAQSRWPTTEFRIVWDDEDQTDKQKWNEFFTSSLSEIAKLYQSSGLKEPRLETEEARNGAKRYLIRVSDFSSGSGTHETGTFQRGYYQSAVLCLNTSMQVTPPGFLRTPSIFVHLNSAASIDRTPDEVKRDYYATLAHELFHAIQSTYDQQYTSLRLCGTRDLDATDGIHSIREGTAVAAAVLAVLANFPDHFENTNDPLPSRLWKRDDLFGAFPYHTEFLSAPFEGQDQSGRRVYKTGSFWQNLAERYGGLKIFDTMLKTSFEVADEPTLRERYKWLEKVIKKITGETMYTFLPEFYAEFGSFVPSRYKGSNDDWAGYVFRRETDQAKQSAKCLDIDLSSRNGHYSELKINDAMERGTATCIDLRWADVDSDFYIAVEAVHKDLKIVDQIHIGVSSLNSNDQVDNCHEVRKERGNGECGYGKLLSKKLFRDFYARDWVLGGKFRKDGSRFFTRPLGRSGKAILTLTNLAPDPFETETLSESLKGGPVVLRFSIGTTTTADNRRFSPPEVMQLRAPGGELMNFNPLEANRYTFYGLAQGDPPLPGSYGTTFGIAATDGSKKTFAILPRLEKDTYKFGVTGVLWAIASNETGAMSGFCDYGGEQKPIGTVIKSDDQQLRFRVKTNLCSVGQDGTISIADTLDAEFILPFGQRYFAETAATDVVSPGLELYIDEYLKEAAASGIPIPSGVLLSDGTVPGMTRPQSSVNDAGTETVVNPSRATCECSCEEFKKLKGVAENAKKNSAVGPEFQRVVVCLQQCQKKYAQCPK